MPGQKPDPRSPAGQPAAEWVSELLESRDRARGAATFAPDGLYLAGVRYDAGYDLPVFPADALAPLPHAFPLAPY